MRIPGKFARDSNRLRTWGMTKRKREKERGEKKERHLGVLAYAIDITQAVALNDYDTGTLWIHYSGALNKNTNARARVFATASEGTSAWKKCIARGTMGSHNEHRGRGKKENGANDLIDATESAAVLRLAFPERANRTWKEPLPANFCRNRSFPTFDNDITSRAEMLNASILEPWKVSDGCIGRSCGAQVQERRFRIVRPAGNPDRPLLRFRHASPQGEGVPCVKPTRVNPFVPENLTRSRIKNSFPCENSLRFLRQILYRDWSPDCNQIRSQVTEVSVALSLISVLRSLRIPLLLFF